MSNGNAATRPRPRVTVKLAQSLDGRIATSTGNSQWISCEAARAFAHELRASHDAVMVGIGTVLQDNPRLTVRLAPGNDPRRVVLDSRLRIPLDCALLTDRPELTTIICAPDAPVDARNTLERAGASLIECPRLPSGDLDLEAVLAALRDRHVTSVMVEGGSRVITTLLRLGLVDRLVVVIAPKVLGDGLAAIGDLGIRAVADAITLANPRVSMLGSDILVDAALNGQA